MDKKNLKKELEDMKEMMLGHLVHIAGRTSEFKEVRVTKTDEGLAVCVNGQTFGVIHAVAAIIMSVHANNKHIPLDVLLDMVSYAVKVFDQCDVADMKEITEGMDKHEFEDLMKKLFGKE